MGDIMLHGALNMPLPDDPAQLNLATWMQFKDRARQASTRIANLEDEITALRARIEAVETALPTLLRKLIKEQSEGEWDDATIKKDVAKFSKAILALIAQQQDTGGKADE